MGVCDADRTRSGQGRGRRSGLGCRFCRGSAAFIARWLASSILAAGSLALGLAPPVPMAAVAADQGFRELAPGVLTVVQPDLSADEAVPRGPLLEITEGLKDLDWVPQRVSPSSTLVARGGRLEYPRDVWCLEFAFKAPRRMAVEMPAPDGRMRRTTVWYLVYRVRNTGGRRVLIGEDAEGSPDPSQRVVETFEKPIRFLPHFVLESREGLSQGEGLVKYRGYLDRLMPAAMAAIRRVEDPARTFLDSAAMAATDIQPGEERWGVATWEGIDPRIDYFSIYVRGLTNATRWRKKPGSSIGPNDPPGAKMEETLESLRLDFWRPGEVGGREDIQIGYRGMFERMALGGSILAAVNWPDYAKTRPAVGLRRMGLSWSDPGLQEPAGQGAATSYLPVATVLNTLAGMADSAARNQALPEVAADVVGDRVHPGRELGGRLVAVAGPVDPHEGLLGEILGGGMVAKLMEEERDEPVLPELDEFGEGRHVAIADAEHQCGGAVACRGGRHHRRVSRHHRVSGGREMNGAEEDRTPNLGIANAALSQLSYRPVRAPTKAVGRAVSLGKHRSYGSLRRLSSEGRPAARAVPNRIVYS
jgi:hypothetical protein